MDHFEGAVQNIMLIAVCFCAPPPPSELLLLGLSISSNHHYILLCTYTLRFNNGGHHDICQ